MRSIENSRRARTGTILILAGLLLAADPRLQAAENTIGPIAGTVVDAAGKPAPAAVVWLIGGSSVIETRVLAQTVADQQGHFQFDAVPWNRNSSTDSPPMLTARDAAGRIGASDFSMQDEYSIPRNCRITLIDGKDFKGRLIDQAGRPIAKAAVKPLFWLDSGQPNQVLVLPPEFQDKLGAETDAEGRFTIRGFPASGLIYARFDAGDFGSPLVRWNLGKSATIRFSRAGGLQGSLTCAKDAGVVGGIRFILVGNPDDSPEADFSINYFQKGTTQADGTFRLDKVPPGKYTVQLQLAADFPYCLEEQPMVEVKSGETARIELALTPAVKVQGKVVDKETKKGVAGVRVALYNYGPAQNREAVTGADGSFTFYSKPGQAGLQLYVWQVPDRYIMPSWSEMPAVTVSAETTVPPIALERAVELELNVVDATGKPAPNAEIHYADSRSETPWGGYNHQVLRADAGGRLTLGRYSPGDTLIVRARNNVAASERKKISLRRLRGPVRLVLSEKTTFAIRGTLIDDAGEPIPPADVSLIADLGKEGGPGLWGKAGNVDLDKRRSDAQGNFVFGGLWPDCKYQLLIKTPGHERYASARIDAAAGKTSDLGKIALPRTSHSVAGTVLDSAGKPVAGAHVFNSGDGPEPIETVSDAAGEFRLQGFRKGPVCVFALKQGYRFIGLRTEAGTTGARLTMLRDDEPATTSSVPYAPLAFEEKKKLARTLLEQLWAAAGKNDKPAGGQVKLLDRAHALLGGIRKSRDAGLKQSLIPLMQRIDAELARKWTAERGDKPAGVNGDKKDPLNRIAETDLDEALSMLDENPQTATRQLSQLFYHFNRTDPKKSLLCAEEAIVRVRTFDQPGRALSLLSWAQMIISLDRKEAGRQLRNEALTIAERWKPSPCYDDALRRIAAAMAPHDFDRAVKLLEKIAEKSARKHSRIEVAAALDDPAKVEPLLEGLEPAQAREVRLGLALRIAPNRPAEAVRLMDKILSEDRSGINKAEQLTNLAEAIGTRDSALTISLIDRIFALYLPPVKPVKPADGGDADPSARAARLAVLARKVGHPDMERVLFQAFALRPTPAEADSPVPAMESVVRMAFILAQADPAAAKQMLLTIEPGIEALDGREDWFRAWALADPQRAMELADRELALFRQKNSRPDCLEELRAMADVWTTPPGERIERADLPDTDGPYGSASRGYF